MQRPPNQNPKRLAPSLKRAALQIARFRAILDWALALPQWEAPIDLSLKRLDIKAGRQGVSQATALRNLPIEKKYRIIRTILSGELPTPCFSETNRLARLAGITLHDRSPTFDRLPSAKWEELRKKITLRLATRYQQYKNAQQELFAHFYQLPSACVAKLCSLRPFQDDARQEARLALLDAIDRIDPEENFAAYAQQWIERRVRNFLMREQVPVKAPINVISKSLRSEPGGSEPLTRALKEGIVQLDNPSQSDAERLSLQSSPETIPNQVALRNDDRAAIERALFELTDKQREVIEFRFGLKTEGFEYSLAQIAKISGISRQQVFQREKRALQKLRLLLEPIKKEQSERDGMRALDRANPKQRASLA